MPKSDRVDTKLLELLVCPVTQGSLVYDKKVGELISLKAKLAYPIKDGIPVMLAEEARHISLEEKKKYKRPEK